ncbi:MAG: hypothetical protein J5766_01920, partial [Clostridia bacterium]|nr:hypothetical protein [Clostridia bacterium]
GGGGTDFSVIFDYIRKSMKDLPACIIIFTDGKGPYPKRAEAMDIPVLWIINNTEITPPFGRTVRLLQNNSNRTDVRSGTPETIN